MGFVVFSLLFEALGVLVFYTTDKSDENDEIRTVVGVLIAIWVVFFMTQTMGG